MADDHRKSPRQARSKHVVEAIITATARVVIAEGCDAATTTRVAEVAGVSVGSLYQYFSSREALLVALLTRHTDAMVAALGGALERSREATLRAALGEVTRSLLACGPELNVALSPLLPFTGELRRVHESCLERMRTLVAAFLAGRPNARAETTTAAMVIVDATHAVFASAARVPGLMLSRTVIEQVQKLLLGFFAAADPV